MEGILSFRYIRMFLSQELLFLFLVVLSQLTIYFIYSIITQKRNGGPIQFGPILHFYGPHGV